MTVLALLRPYAEALSLRCQYADTPKRGYAATTETYGPMEDAATAVRFCLLYCPCRLFSAGCRSSAAPVLNLKYNPSSLTPCHSLDQICSLAFRCNLQNLIGVLQCVHCFGSTRSQELHLALPFSRAKVDCDSGLL